MEEKRLLQGIHFQMNIEQPALVSSYHRFVQEQTANEERFFLLTLKISGLEGTQDDLVLILQVRKLRPRDGKALSQKHTVNLQQN